MLFMFHVQKHKPAGSILLPGALWMLNCQYLIRPKYSGNCSSFHFGLLRSVSVDIISRSFFFFLTKYMHYFSTNKILVRNKNMYWITLVGALSRPKISEHEGFVCEGL